MKKVTKAVAALMLMVAVVFVAGCTKPDDPNNEGNNNDGDTATTYSTTVSANPTNGGIVSGGGTYQDGQNCTVSATANSGYTFANWTENGNEVSNSENYTFAMTSDRTLVANFTYNGGNNGYDYVDLGLPSGLLWATCNVGASSPEDYGYYFAWGETGIKREYSWYTYAYGYEEEGDPVILHLTKYNTDDNLTILQPGDDAATANYGGRMPTMAECQELLDNCTSVWTTLNGVPGRRFTGPNGNSLFLPAAGRRCGVEHDFNYIGLYWTSSLEAPGSNFAYSLRFYSSWVVLDGADRSLGYSVRSVREN